MVGWNNKSVLDLAGTNDPVKAMIRKSQAVVLDALQKGWSGPPYDPFDLAELLGMALAPTQDVADARTVPTDKGFLIEFNPSRPKTRMRYSIAHEIGHTLFPDCAESIRNREAYHVGAGDDWQIEVLCNIAAAEILMPIGSFDKPLQEMPDLHTLLDLREQYEVSAEALLLRAIRITSADCAFISASDLSSGSYRVDYAVPSINSDFCIPRGMSIPVSSAAGQCERVGFTAHSDETWPKLGQVSVEFVGAPPYPGHARPRVLGLLRRGGAQSHSGALGIDYVRGDATSPRGLGIRIIGQIVNDKALTWGGGLSLAVRRKWPHVQRQFTKWVLSTKGALKLGSIQVSEAEQDLLVCSMVAQSGYGESDSPRIRYLALRNCLSQLSDIAVENKASVHIPRLGCGQAGGVWEVVQELVMEELVALRIPVHVYDLPGQNKDKRLTGSPTLFPV